MQDTNDQFDEAAVWAEATSDADKAARKAAESDTGDQQDRAAESPQDEAAYVPPKTAPEITEPDLWTDATPEQRAAFQAAQQHGREWEHRARSNEGRINRFQSERDELRKKLGTVTSVSEHEDLGAYLASEDWNKVKAEYGDDLKPIFNAFETLAARDKRFEERFGELDDTRVIQLARETEGWLDREAPDRAELFGREDFIPWLNSPSTPDAIREMAERNWEGVVDPAEVKVVADVYRAQIGGRLPASDPQSRDTGRRRDLQLDGNRTHRTRAPIMTAPDPNDVSEATWAEATEYAMKKVGLR